MNVSLPDPMRDWVEQQTKSGRYDNASECVRDLIRHDQDKAAKIAHMQRLVDEAIENGTSDQSLEDIRVRSLASFRCHGFSEFVHEHERRLVLDIQVKRHLHSR